jgi:hypothetical protein
MFKFIKVLLALTCTALGLASPAFAAVSWDFTPITGELAGLGTALITAMGVAIGAVITVFGLKRSIGVITGIVGKLFGR